VKKNKLIFPIRMLAFYLWITFITLLLITIVPGMVTAQEIVPAVKIEPGPIIDNQITADIKIENLPSEQKVMGFHLKLGFDPSVLQYKSFSKGSYFSQIQFWPNPDVNQDDGYIVTDLGRDPNTLLDSSGTILSITFDVISERVSFLTLPEVYLRDQANNDIDLLKEPAQIGTGSLECRSVSPLEDIEVAKGTEKEAIGLPSTVEVTLDDESTMSLSVVWDNGSPEYDGATAGSYTFTGILTLVEGIANSDDLKAEVKVNVSTITTIKWGDVNGDEVVNATDVLAVWAKIVRETPFPVEQ